MESRFVVVFLRLDSATALTLRRGTAETGMLANATSRRQAKSAIVPESNHIVLRSLQPEAIKARFGELILGQGKHMVSISELSIIVLSDQQKGQNVK